MILSYKVFESSDDFTNWQRDNLGVTIKQVSPIPREFNFSENRDSEVYGSMEVSVFVLYVEGI